mgnify:CR=1 FL=1
MHCTEKRHSFKSGIAIINGVSGRPERFEEDRVTMSVLVGDV